MLNFDDVDLGIIAIAVICVIAVIVLAIFKSFPAELAAVLSPGITAIATLAGRRIKTALSESIDGNTQPQ